MCPGTFFSNNSIMNDFEAFLHFHISEHIWCWWTSQFLRCPWGILPVVPLQSICFFFLNGAKTLILLDWNTAFASFLAKSQKFQIFILCYSLLPILTVNLAKIHHIKNENGDTTPYLTNSKKKKETTTKNSVYINSITQMKYIKTFKIAKYQ
jgi:hypothetical protein